MVRALLRSRKASVMASNRSDGGERVVTSCSGFKAAMAAETTPLVTEFTCASLRATREASRAAADDETDDG